MISLLIINILFHINKHVEFTSKSIRRLFYRLNSISLNKAHTCIQILSQGY